MAALLVIIGAALIVGGAALLSIPAAVIVGGAFVFGAGVNLARSNR